VPADPERPGPTAISTPLVVVDASVVVALATSTSDAASSLAARLSSSILHAPHLLPTEVDSAIRGLVLSGKLTQQQGASARAAAHALPIDLWPWSLLSERAWQLRANLSTYDAGYAALAEHLEAPLLTGDVRLAAAPGVRCQVEVFR